MKSSLAQIDSIPWQELEHAYGSAADLPDLFKRIPKASGEALSELLEELCSRVLHQGTIYSASPAAVGVLLELLPSAKPADQIQFLDLLSGFCQAARQAFADGRAIACHAGGDPLHGEQIKNLIQTAKPGFASYLQAPAPELRAYAVQLLCAFADTAPDKVRIVSEQYQKETDPAVRNAILTALELTNCILDHAATIEALETDVSNRLVLRRAQVRSMAENTPDLIVDDLIHCYLQSGADAVYYTGTGFFEAIESLGTDRKQSTLLKVLALSEEPEILRVTSERLLRSVFADQRTGWENVSYSTLRADGSKAPQSSQYSFLIRSTMWLIVVRLLPFLRPFYMRSLARQNPGGIPERNYWAIKSEAPALPEVFSASQAEVLKALAGKAELWHFRTNLWILFGLPSNAQGLSLLVEARRSR
jgi:hypothetical protein